MRKLKKTLVPLACLASFTAVSQAATIIGTQALVDFATPSANTGNINTSTVFTIGELVSNLNGSGAFAGMPVQDFGPVTFDENIATSFNFGDAVFGTFNSVIINRVPGEPLGVAAFYILGNYTPGNYVTGTGGLSSFTLTFNQTPPQTGGISDSGTFAIPPATAPGTPEPATLALIGSALIALGATRRSRA